jgi:phosphoribosylformylglycinamidine synthase
MDLRGIWSETTYQMQKHRDNPITARQEKESRLDENNPGIYTQIPFELKNAHIRTLLSKNIRPKVAIFREQGVNSHLEMAAAFIKAGFNAIDVHMSDLIDQKETLKDFKGLVACGGFSYGDVLGAGEGWAKSILFNPALKQLFCDFFERSDTFSLGICNGCQMFSHLRSIIPGSEHWPYFVQNTSQQFEARFSMLQIEASPSILMKDMQGAQMPIVVSHGEGRAVYSTSSKAIDPAQQGLVVARFIDHYGKVTETYPNNPNGSPMGITGLTTQNGRVTIMMPHPERVARNVQMSYTDELWSEDSPWMKMFYNARTWVG